MARASAATIVHEDDVPAHRPDGDRHPPRRRERHPVRTRSGPPAARPRRSLRRALLRLPRPVQGPRDRPRRRPPRRAGRPRRRRRRRASAVARHRWVRRRRWRALTATWPRSPDGWPMTTSRAWFSAADVAVFPYPRPFSSSGALALALAHGTPGAALAAARPLRRCAERHVRRRSTHGRWPRRLDELATNPSALDELRRWSAVLAAGRRWPVVAEAHAAPLRGGDRRCRACCSSAPSGRVTPATKRCARRSYGRSPATGSSSPAAIPTPRRAGTAYRRSPPAPPPSPVSCAGADAVVVGGGTVFKTLHRSTGRRPNSLLRNACLLAAAAKASGKQVALVGVGAGDLRGRQARALARWLVRRVDLLVLRDEESASALAGVGAPAPFWIGADPAWALRPAMTGRGGTPTGRDGGDGGAQPPAGDDRLVHRSRRGDRAAR